MAAVLIQLQANLDPGQVPDLPESETAALCSDNPTMHQGSQTRTKEAGGGRTGC